MKKLKHSHADSTANNYLILLVLALTFLCYMKVLGFNVTQLDDTVFIQDKHDFISSFKNIPVAFS